MKMSFIVCKGFDAPYFRAGLLILVLTVCFFGCASQRPLYSWGSYEDQVFAYLRGESPWGQIAALERDMARIMATGGAFPPGFNAHLGMLYAEFGDIARATAFFEAEKALFPEAAVYMNFILERLRR